jgi:hypothetical protein
VLLSSCRKRHITFPFTGQENDLFQQSEPYMKINRAWIAASLVACLLSGFVGACFATLLFVRRTAGLLQIQRLELTDAQQRVRAVLSTDDGSVSLRMFSTQRTPMMELGVKDGPEARGHLVIYDKGGRPSITLTTREKDRGILAFSSENTPNQVSMGYSPVGDFEDGHDRGAWGLHIAGPDHTDQGLFVFSTDGKLTGFTVPLEAPRSPAAK